MRQSAGRSQGGPTPFERPENGLRMRTVFRAQKPDPVEEEAAPWRLNTTCVAVEQKTMELGFRSAQAFQNPQRRAIIRPPGHFEMGWRWVRSAAVEDLPGRSSVREAILVQIYRVDLGALCLVAGVFSGGGRSTG